MNQNEWRCYFGEYFFNFKLYKKQNGVFWAIYVPTVARGILYNYHKHKRFGFFVSKERRWISNIRGEEFQRVGRAIFIKSNVLLFDYMYNNSLTQIFKISTSFYQVIILLIEFLHCTGCPDHIVQNLKTIILQEKSF